MHNLLKKILLLLGVLFLIQVGGYSLHGKQQLPEVVAKNRIALVVEEPEYVYFSSEQALSARQNDDVALVLQRAFPVVSPDRNRLDSLPDEVVCSYHFDIELPLPFLATATYSNVYSSPEEDSAYAEGFKSAYIWVLFLWWEVENRNTGQS